MTRRTIAQGWSRRDFRKERGGGSDILCRCRFVCQGRFLAVGELCSMNPGIDLGGARDAKIETHVGRRCGAWCRHGRNDELCCSTGLRPNRTRLRSSACSVAAMVLHLLPQLGPRLGAVLPASLLPIRAHLGLLGDCDAAGGYFIKVLAPTGHRTCSAVFQPAYPRSARPFQPVARTSSSDMPINERLSSSDGRENPNSPK
jgi:hypothetical protein